MLFIPPKINIQFYSYFSVSINLFWSADFRSRRTKERKLRIGYRRKHVYSFSMKKDFWVKKKVFFFTFLRL